MAEPAWLIWARDIQAIAQTGLTYAQDPFDRERYEMLRTLAARMMAAGSAELEDRIETLFAQQHGYATPKLEVRVGVFDTQGRILMVREILDANRWTIPGGWADANHTAAQCAAKEVWEETGYTVRITKLAMALDRTTQGHQPPEPFTVTKLFFLGEITGGSPTTSIETSEVRFFGQDGIPEDLSLGRVLPEQIAALFAHHKDPNKATDFD
ncbi:ADP-ribose pyrophosphatase [Acetobacter cibinongensis]|uniref:ADP-ribose pyrophosphatase n=1 Tax=Acetobacter cibinongensis TaxID=146475 RepID=A0A0D6N4M7_9PROT|nr:NUDIX hydrolase N-terminal domain-containing protein [Acetobacter cibinongensis]GAN60665.1 phosphohydrolase [Acetobacter cibinongensis]GBQ11811.1 phosphohydrolase [Acetobacter cibinongensis NRIC 0482]GEL58696.1 ADP-ribose pyrophosphatase [Acetobacter cibinongensis]